MAALALVGTCVATSYPERSEAGVLALLSRAAGGEVAPGDFVWEPSGGFVDDLVLGRRVLFLAKAGPHGYRDLYRARVSVTRQGRALGVRSVVNLTATDLADEADLVVVGHEAAVVARAHDVVRAVEWFDADVTASRGDLARGRFVSVSFREAPRQERHELQSGGLVLALDDDAAILARSTLELRSGTGRHGAFAVLVRGPGDGGPAPRQREDHEPLEALARPAPEPEAFPPGDDFAEAPPSGWEGSPSPTRVSSSGGVVRVALDMRQLRVTALAAVSSPSSETGHRAAGLGALRGRPWVALAGPTTPDTGAVDRGVLVSPFAPLQWALADGDKPVVMALQSESTAGSASILGFVPGAAGPRERSLLCATASGHFVYLWGRELTSGGIREKAANLDCIAWLPIEGRGGLGITLAARGEPDAWRSLDAGMSMQWRDAGRSVPLLVFDRAEMAPAISPPRGSKWEPDGEQPDPAFAPSVYVAHAEALGTEVVVRLFVGGRFDWVLRAGEKEKSHRTGGQWLKTLAEPERARVWFATGLGIGKRRSPSGLRVAGSLGHPMHRDATVLAAGAGGLAIGRSLPEDPSIDASELPRTASDGALTSAARERGPRQARADLCVLPDGNVLLAEADFDNHEPAASVLLDLGCAEVVALDRGAEQAAWSEGRPQVGAAHDATTLFALARPSRGPVVVAP